MEGLLEKEADLLRLERYTGWSRADLCRDAWKEYVTRHHPGNPTIPLTAWTGNTPLSIAAQEKLSKAKLPPAGRVYNLKCPFCGDYFDTTEDMATPACPKCRKPESREPLPPPSPLARNEGEGGTPT
jgi:hypothetical protein